MEKITALASGVFDDKCILAVAEVDYEHDGHLFINFYDMNKEEGKPYKLARDRLEINLPNTEEHKHEKKPEEVTISGCEYHKSK